MPEPRPPHSPNPAPAQSSQSSQSSPPFNPPISPTTVGRPKAGAQRATATSVAPSPRATQDGDAVTGAEPLGQITARAWVRPLPAWVLLPLRLFLAVTFIYAGIQKLTDPQYFNPHATGYIGKQIAGFANGTPLHGILVGVAAPHAMFFGSLVAYGE